MKICKEIELKEYSTFGIGGKAKFMITPANEVEFLEAINFCKNNKIEFEVIGNGSNILFSDKGYRGCIIVTTGMKNIKLDKANNIIEAESGVELKHLIDRLCEESLSGLESLYGMPGTVGGAVYMNAGSFGVSIGNFINSVKYVDNAGKLIVEKILEKRPIFLYRKGLTKGYIVSTGLDLTKMKNVNRMTIKNNIKDIIKKRAKIQPSGKSAGCIFKNPQEKGSSGRIIQELGFAGKSCGNAIISKKHCNFIINKGNAKAQEVKELIDDIKKTVEKKLGIKLEEEIKIIGD